MCIRDRGRRIVPAQRRDTEAKKWQVPMNGEDVYKRQMLTIILTVAMTIIGIAMTPWIDVYKRQRQSTKAEQIP